MIQTRRLRCEVGRGRILSIEGTLCKTYADANADEKKGKRKEEKKKRREKKKLRGIEGKWDAGGVKVLCRWRQA